MTWGSSIGIGFATGFVGAIAAGIVSYNWSAGRGEPASDNQLLAFFFSVAGFAAAFVFGVVVSRLSGGGFLRGTGITAGFILALAVILNLMANRVNYGAVMVHGEPITMEVEFQLPADWTKDVANTAQFGCALNPNGDRSLGETRPSRPGLILPCAFSLRSTHTSRTIYLTVQSRNNGTPSGKSWFKITLPDDLSTELNQPWSKWSAGTDITNGTTTSYQARFRFVPESVARADVQAEREARLQERWKQFDSLGPNAPLDRYVDAFEPDSDMITVNEVPAKVVTRMTALLKKNPSAFETALRSNDRATVRRAVYALAVTPQIPREITPALVDAGHQVVSYVDSARVKNHESNDDETDKEALPFLDRWDLALDHAAPPINRADFLAILDEMQKASGTRHSTFRTDLPSRVAMKIDSMTAKHR